jgi:hypothetical protein
MTALAGYVSAMRPSQPGLSDAAQFDFINEYRRLRVLEYRASAFPSQISQKPPGFSGCLEPASCAGRYALAGYREMAEFLTLIPVSRAALASITAGCAGASSKHTLVGGPGVVRPLISSRCCRFGRQEPA